ncbi:hypothetical protein [Neobacillus sp. 19]|nr:hypothetical protein FAY30_16915 [Bacillus sp. S3]
MLSLYLLPLLMELREQSWQLKIENTARKLMYEELQAKISDGQSFNNYSIIRNKVEYKINWNDLGLDGRKEVCVKVEKISTLPECKVCGVLE